MPVSYLTWMRGRKPNMPARSASSVRNSAVQTVSSARACSATSSSAPVSAPITKIGTSAPTRSRSSKASVAVATASLVAPPRSAASAHSPIPCP